MKKRFLLLICMVSCMLMVAGCSLTRENPNLDKKTLTKLTKTSAKEWFSCDYAALVDAFGDMTEDELETAISQTDYETIAETYGDMTDEELVSTLSVYGYDEDTVMQLKESMIAPAQAIADLIDQYGDDYAAIREAISESKDYVKMQKKYGAFKKIVDTDYSLASNSASVSVTVTTEKAGKLVVTANYDEDGNQTNWKIEEYQSAGQIMGRAGLNTLMSMAIVFCALIFIAVIIYCLKYINPQKKMEQGEAPAAETQQTALQEAEDVTDDLELVAVITAAIAAAQETECADGLVVRSIIRRS
ncbi:MAG: OadG family protein [Clostridiaceae bacterium]|nr:OadG family protein [Clostridiaceae bacterium]